MAYQSIFSGGSGGAPQPANAMLAKIGSDFTPGKYAQVNQQIALKNPASDLPTLRAQLKNGYITQDQFISQFNKITKNDAAPAPYSAGNLAWALGNAANQVFVQPPVNIVKGIAQTAGHAANELAATPLNTVAPKPQDVIEQQSKQIYQTLLKNGTPRQVAQDYADYYRARGYQQLLNDAGIDINDSPVTIGRKAVGNIGGTVANILPVGAALEGGSLVARMAKSAAFGGAAGGINNLASDDLTPQSEAASIAGGAVAGAILPPVTEGVKSLIGRALGRAQAARDAGVQVPRSALDQFFPKEGEARAATSTAKTASKAAKAPQQTVAIKDLTSYEGAPDKAQVAKYKADIQAGKPIEPLLVKKDSLGNLGIEDGKHRFEAAKQARLTEVPIKDVTRPAAAEQAAVERAHNAGNAKAEAAAVKRLPDQAMNPNAAMSAEAKAATLAKARQRVASGEAENLGKVAPEMGTSKVGTSIQEKAVARGLKDTFGDSAQYEKLNLADQAKKAVAITQNRALLDQIINGEKPLPSGVRADALIKAVEEHPELSRDSELLNRLSASYLASESSRSAQELRLAAERNPDSPVQRIQDVRQARETSVSKRLGQPVEKVVTATAKDIKASVPKVSRQDWHQFIESIKC